MASRHRPPTRPICVACAAARPSLTTFPVYLNNTSDPRGTYCMLRLFMEPHPKACTLLDKLFPPGLNETIPPTFKAQPGPYWCFTRAGSNSVGDLPAKWCHHTYNVNGWANMTATTSRSNGLALAMHPPTFCDCAYPDTGLEPVLSCG